MFASTVLQWHREVLEATFTVIDIEHIEREEISLREMYLEGGDARTMLDGSEDHMPLSKQGRPSGIRLGR